MNIFRRNRPSPSDAGRTLAQQPRSEHWRIKATARKLREELGMSPSKALR